MCIRDSCEGAAAKIILTSSFFPSSSTILAATSAAAARPISPVVEKTLTFSISRLNVRKLFGIENMTFRNCGYDMNSGIENDDIGILALVERALAGIQPENAGRRERHHPHGLDLSLIHISSARPL